MHDTHEFQYEGKEEFDVRMFFLILPPSFLFLALVWLAFDWCGFIQFYYRVYFNSYCSTEIKDYRVLKEKDYRILKRNYRIEITNV